MEPLRIFEKFKLDEIDKNWVESIWNQEFMFIDKIPGDYLLFVESEDMEILLRETCTTVKTWIDSNKNSVSNERSEVSWQTLCALNVDQKALLALLGYIIKTGQSLDADEDSRQTCLLATSMYLTLLAIPGSGAYQIFHENLYEIVLKTLELTQHLMPVVKKPVKNQDIESLYAREEESNALLQTEKITLTNGLNSIMYNMILMLDSWSMRDYVRSLELTVHSLIEVTKLGADINDFQEKKRSSKGSTGCLVYNSFAALSQLCNSRHGSIDVTIKLIAKYMLPHFLYNYTSLPTKSLNIVRETSIQFLKTLLNVHGKLAEDGVMILIQRLMINCPERLEARQKQAVIIVKLTKICSTNFYIKFIKNLILFAHNNKIACRVFSQEIIAKILESDDRNDDGELENDDDSDANPEINVGKILLATVLSRCTDVSSMVRGRAMQTLADYTDNSENIFVYDLFKLTDDNYPLPKLEDIQNSFTDDVNLFPDTKTLMTMLKIRAEDERATIRTRTIQILRNCVMIIPELLEEVVPIISNHCRDPMMMVRRYSIQELSSLLEAFPDHPSLYKVWVKSVVPQIFDVEAKVQEKVLESMEDLIISRIMSENDDLPWRIMDELTFKKMRKHLTRACDCWENIQIITDDLIKKIQSQINSEHNIPAWILISAIVENKVLPSMKRYFDDYQSIFTGKGFFEYLALEVLRCCWPKFDKEFLQKLSSDLLKLFYESMINPELISISMDILYGICKHLKPSDTSEIERNMQELIQKSEKVIEKIILDVEHTQEDVSHYLKAICTLGHASFLCTTNIKLPVLRILQGMLIDWEMMPKSLRNARELQATTIVALGQQAMREQSIAYEMTPIFGQLLSAGVDCSNDKADAAVRVNAAKALADVCTRFTALVEPHLPDMCISMKGENASVREAIVVIFIQLLVEDYIKVKGTFFFHILTMLSDPDDTIREMTVFLIKERLLVKNKTLISQQFLESIFHYNDCEMDKKYYERKMREAEKAALTLPGRCNEAKRKMIYNFMLEHLDPPGKLKLLAGLTTQVLNGVISSRIKINEEKGECVLKDTLHVIGSHHLQASSCGIKQVDEEAEESANNNSQPVAHAVNVIVEGIKKHHLTVLMPTLMKLKKKVLKKSELVEEVSKLFVKIGSEFNKEQLASLYNEYPEIEKELEFDIRKFNNKSQSQEQLEIDDDDGGGEGNERTEAEAKNTLVSQSSTLSQMHPLLDCNRIPRIVLHRLPVTTDKNSGHCPSPSCSTETRKMSVINSNDIIARSNRYRTPSCSLSNVSDEFEISSTPKERKNSGKYLRF